jgi:hypothetical protein
MRKPAATLKDFMTRITVLKLYRDCLKAVAPIQDLKAKEELKEWIQSDFKQYKNERDSEKIKTLLSQGQSQLRTLVTSVTLARKLR